MCRRPQIVRVQDGFADPTRLQQALTKDPRQASAVQRRGQTVALRCCQHKIGDRALAQFCAFVDKHQFFHPRRQFGPRLIIKRAAGRLMLQPDILRIQYRIGNLEPHDRNRRGKSRQRQIKPTRRREGQTAAQPVRATYRLQRCPCGGRIKDNPQRRCAALHPGQMQIQPRDALTGVIPEGLDQAEVRIVSDGIAVLVICANRAFHSASSYSDAAVLSQTSPPPTLKRA